MKAITNIPALFHLFRNSLFVVAISLAFVFNSYSQPVVTVTLTHVSCHNGSDGVVRLGFTGGSTPYQVSFNGGVITTTSSSYFDYSGLSNGVYDWEVKDNAGNTKTGTETITQPAVLSATVAPTNVTCFGANNGIISVSGASGGYGTYEYSIDNGSTWQAIGSFANLAPGTYQVSIRDAANTACVIDLDSTPGTTITQPAILSASVNKTDVTCFGANDGTITVSNPLGGYGTFQVSINGINWFDVSASASYIFSALAPNIYTVQIRDAAHQTCEITLGNPTITEPAALTASVNKTDVTCFGGSDGIISVSGASGGSGTYECSIDNGSTWQATGSFANLASGTYQVSIRDAAHPACIIDLDGTPGTTITQPAILSASVNKTDVTCFGANNGKIQVFNPQGGHGNYEVSIDGNVWNEVLVNSSFDFTNLSPSNYNIQIRDKNYPQCFRTLGSLTINQPPALSLTVNSNSPICENGTITLFANPTSGTPGYSYSWTGPDGFTSTIQNPTISNAGTAKAGIYIVTVTDNNGCIISKDTQVEIIPLPTASVSGTNAVCKGAPAISVTFNNPQPLPIEVTYTLNGTAKTLSITGASQNVAVPTGNPGDFTFTITSVKYISGLSCQNNNITGQITATVTVRPLPTAEITGTQSVCPGDVAKITFSNPGTLPVKVFYTLNGVDQTPLNLGTDSLSSSEISFSTTTPGTYNYSITRVEYQDALACSNTSINESAIVTVRPIPTATISGDNTVCRNDAYPDVLITNTSALPVKVVYSIDGADQTPVDINTGQCHTLKVNTSVAKTVVYSLKKVYYPNTPSCENNITGQSVSVTILPIPTATISGTVSVCQGETNPVLTFTNPENREIIVDYTVNAVAASPITIAANSAYTISVATVTPGSFVYSLTRVRYSGSVGCQNNNPLSSATVVVRPTPNATISAGSNFLCKGSAGSVSIQNNMTEDILVEYSLNGGTSVSRTILGNQTISVNLPTNTPGIYEYELKNVRYSTAPNCLQTISGQIVTVEVLDIPDVQISASVTEACEGSTSPIITFTNLRNRDISLYYKINDGSNIGPVNIAANGTATINVPTTTDGTFNYSVVSIVYDGFSCPNNAPNKQINIKINPIPVITVTPISQAVCSGRSTAVVNFTSDLYGTSYSWSATTGTPAISGFTSSGNGPSIPSQTLTNPSGSHAGTVTYTIIPSVGVCSGTSVNHTVTVHPIPVVTCPSNQTLCLNDNPINLSTLAGLSPAGGTFSGPGVTDNSFYPSLAGVGLHSITYNYTSAGNCSNSCTFSITVNQAPVIPNQTFAICNGSLFVLAPETGIPEGSVVPPGTNYSWTVTASNVTGVSNGSGTQISHTLNLINPNNPGSVTYTVTPVSGGGCTGYPFTVNVTVNPNPSLSLRTTFHQQYINPRVDYLRQCNGNSVYYIADNDLEVFYWNNYQWVYPTMPYFDSYNWKWQYSIGTPEGPSSVWEDAIGEVTSHYEYKMPPGETSPYRFLGDYYFRFAITNEYGCTSYSDLLHLEVISDHIVNPGPDIEVNCSGSPTAIPLTGATLQNRTGGYICASWSIMSLDPPNAGINGNLSNTSCTTSPANVTYTPPANYSGVITLALTSNDPDGDEEYSCTGVYETRNIIVKPSVAAFAGNPQTVCMGDEVVLTGTVDPPGASVVWNDNSAGGTFTYPNSPNTTYILPNPTTGGEITLTFSPVPGGNCTVSSSTVITVVDAPYPSGVTICKGSQISSVPPLTSTSTCPQGSLAAGPNFGRTTANSGNLGGNWYDTDDARTDNGYYAYAYVSGNSYSNYLRITNFGFNIPDDATIKGIIVSIKRYSTGVSNNNRIRDNILRLRNQDGNITGDNKASSSIWPTANETVNYGGSEDLWGASWSPSQINDIDFGVYLSVYNTNNYYSRTAYVDYISITVHYSINAVLYWYTSSAGGAHVHQGSPFNPFTDLSATERTTAGAPYTSLTDTNTPGIYPFYVQCSTSEGCRRRADLVIEPAPTILKPDPKTVSSCDFANQGAVDSVFNEWLSGFKVNGSLNPSTSFNPPNPTAPQLCTGGTVNVAYSVTDPPCLNETTVTSSFVLTPPPAFVYSTSDNVTRPSSDFSSQADLNAAFDAWYAGFQITGGCAHDVIINPENPVAPGLCGGTYSFTASVEDLCLPRQEATFSFTVTPPPPVVVTKAVNVTRSACDFTNQAAADADFAAWLATTSVSGGISPTFLPDNTTAPDFYGGSVTVTWEIKDRCYDDSFSATFTITPPPPIVLNKASDVIQDACHFTNQNDLNNEFTTWLASTNASGGCSPSVVPDNNTAPDLCGGSTVVTWTISDIGYTTTTHKATFTIRPADALQVDQPNDISISACDYPTQDFVNTAFNAWLNSFGYRGGCDPSATFNPTDPQAPSLCTGGTVTVQRIVSDLCSSDIVRTATFTLTTPPALTVSTPGDFIRDHCQYTQQLDLDTDFQQWLNSLTATGGCSPAITRSQVTYPDLCNGGNGSVTWTVVDVCGTVTRTASYQVEPRQTLTVSCPGPGTITDCLTPVEIETDYRSWLAQFTNSGGCNITAPTIDQLIAAYPPPSSEGGISVVTYKVTDGCGQVAECQATYTVPVCFLHYRTKGNTWPDNWTNTDIWETSRTGNASGPWTFANSYPTYKKALSIRIRDGHSVEVTSPVSVRNTFIEGGGVVAILSGGKLTNVGNSSSFIIDSSADDKNGTLISVNNGFSGELTYKRWLNSSRWYITSPPVTVGSGFETNADSINMYEGSYDFATYIESNNYGWNYFAPPLPSSLISAKGYLAALASEKTRLVFPGTLNDGDVTIQVFNTNVDGTHSDGWNAIGNPYTSAIRVAEDWIYGGSPPSNWFLKENYAILEPYYAAIYVWNETGTYNGSGQFYKAICNTGYIPKDWEGWYGGIVTLLDKEVQAGQGFLINAGGNGGTIRFTKTMQFARPSLELKSAHTSWPGITLIAENGGEARYTAVGFNENMTTGLDKTYEAGLLATDNFQIYTTLLSDDEGYEMEIQSLPDNQYESLVIPVGVDLPQGGMVTFRMDGIILPKDIIPVLEDRLLRVNTYMPDNSHSYTASLSKNSYGTGRFYIRFGSATPISPIVKDLIHLSARYANSKITIFGAAGRNTTAIVYDINGRKLGEYRLDNESRNDIPAQDLVTGVYLLSIKGDRGTQVIKLPVLKE